MAEVDVREQQRKARSGEETNGNAEEKILIDGESPKNEGEKSGATEENIVTDGKASPVQSSSHAGEKPGGAGKGEDAKPKESFVRKIIGKIGLDVGTVMMMFK
jgi:hypothetical protein